jgi:RND superfamily putative drug exporter
LITLPARSIIRFRAAIIVFWIFAVAAASPRAARVDDSLQVEGSTLQEYETERARALIREAFPQPIVNYFVVALSSLDPLDSAATRSLLESLVEAATGEPYISRVISFLSARDSTLISDDGRTTFFLAAVDAAEGTSATDRAVEFREAIHSAANRVPFADRNEVFVTGGPALDYDVRTASKEDAESGERNALPFSAMILILAFGALVAAALPLIIGIMAITCSLALVQIAASFHSMSVFVLTIVSMVGLAVGIDYSLLIVTRFREELNRGHGARGAAARSITTAGKAVVTSGITVAVGFASLLVTPITETRSIGIGGLFVVTSAVLLSVTLLPATLSYLGRSIDVPRWLARRLAWYHAPTSWERWARWLVHHPWQAIVMGGLTIAVITWPLAQIKIGLPRSRWFPENTESAEGVRLLESIGSRGALQPVRIVLQAPEGDRVVGTRYLRGLRRFSDSVKVDPRVGQVRGVVDLEPGMSMLQYVMLYSNVDAARARVPDFYSAYLSDDNRTTLMDVFLADTTSFTGSMDVVRRIRGVVQSGVQGLDSVEVLVGGFAASSVDLQDDLLEHFPTVILLVLIITAVMLAVAFQSVLVPVKAVALNCMSVLGAFGVTVLVFQNGFGAELFGLDGPTEAVMVVVPVVVFAVVFGLSMDYGVFLLARIKEAFDRSGRNDQATMEGLTATASVITSAAAIMIVVFGVFSFSRVLAAQMMGFGLAVAVFLDATVIRMVLFPAAMHIAGKWNWWPGVRATPSQAGHVGPSTGEVSQGPDVPRSAHPARDMAP